MTCASCVSIIENVLKAIDGVINASVNLMTGQAKIRYDSEKTGKLIQENIP